MKQLPPTIITSLSSSPYGPISTAPTPFSICNETQKEKMKVQFKLNKYQGIDESVLHLFVPFDSVFFCIINDQVGVGTQCDNIIVI